MSDFSKYKVDPSVKDYWHIEVENPQLIDGQKLSTSYMHKDAKSSVGQFFDNYLKVGLRIIKLHNVPKDDKSVVLTYQTKVTADGKLKSLPVTQRFKTEKEMNDFFKKTSFIERCVFDGGHNLLNVKNGIWHNGGIDLDKIKNLPDSLKPTKQATAK